jgi:hypothetical protein
VTPRPPARIAGKRLRPAATSRSTDCLVAAEPFTARCTMPRRATARITRKNSSPPVAVGATKKSVRRDSPGTCATCVMAAVEDGPCISRHGLAHVKAEFQQFAVDPWAAPARIRFRPASDQRSLPAAGQRASARNSEGQQQRENSGHDGREAYVGSLKINAINGNALFNRHTSVEWP